MPDAITSLTQGVPVALGQIDRELKRLWQEGEGAATRASLMNFAVYCEGPEMMKQTTELIFEFTRDHACRAILIGLDRAKPGSSVEACISAHCHLSRAGQKQVCSEQISFLLGRDGLPLIPNIVFTHLDSDLPLVLWWRAEFPEESEEQLWTRVDRLLYDSHTWPKPAAQFHLLRDIIVPASPRIALCDLNWTRTLYMRQAIAQIFDHPECLDELPSMDGIEIVHAPGMRTTAILLSGWLGAQLDLKFLASDAGGIRFQWRGREITVSFREEAGRSLGSVRLKIGEKSFLLAHREGSSFLHADVCLPAGRDSHLLMASGKEDLVSLLNDELNFGGKHKVYLKAVRLVAGAL
jgi:glucose-6-phosphate dehydrogenase assembly protein OpcA